MQSIDSSKQTFKRINIGFFYSTVDSNTYKDTRLVELLNIVSQKDNINKYNYAIYTDHCLLKTNMFIPIFHTIYIGCIRNNIIIPNHYDIWVSQIFENNNYYMFNNDKDKEFDYSNFNIKFIDSIKEIQ